MSRCWNKIGSKAASICGSFERAVEKIRQNKTLRAEMILAIERIIEKNK
jgi:hypothetical protein